jgi:PAS domain S-box-containing protein
MDKDNKDFLEVTEKLNKENAALKQEIKEYINAIKTGNIDALIIPHEKTLKVYSEKTADKPFRILIEKMHEGAVTINEDGTILYCNSYFANMVNMPLQKVIGTKFENFIDFSSKEHFKTVLKQGIVNALKEEVYLFAGYGKKIPVLMTLNLLSFDNIFVLSIILTDLTIQNENQEKLKYRTKQLEQKNKELESANKELAFQIEEKDKRGTELRIAKTDVIELEGLNTHKESVLTTLSHDLRSPLAGIIQTVELLKENFESLEQSAIDEILDLLHKSSINELRMLDYLVEWARIKYASEAFSPAQIELTQYVKKVFDTFNEAAIANNIQFHNEIEENMKAFADGKMLLSILQNIVSNAIKYAPAGGKITVSAKRKEDMIIIGIKDTGSGMSKEIMDTLFTPQMISLSIARKVNKGAGIGLLLVQGFVEKNGGKIWVESTEGEGSSFYFTLPEKKPQL